MKRLILTFTLLTLSFPAMAAWQLDAQRSSLFFVSTKKNTVAETHHFDDISGKYEQGQARLAIDLASVETNIDIRNERMQEHLFEVGDFATALVTVEVPEQRVADLAPGDNLILDTTATLSLHGSEKPVDTVLSVTRLADDTIQVANLRPVIINAGDFGLARGVEKLREIAGLPSISPAVPAQFTLYYTKR
ncbi:YceI family protein [Thiohalorhabdus sp. Cl-TMA]|uniref:YceI family protein n=1 Tax=Thiohalorhabdus methylotrophus TaxID=3242694 RepID=A0ABV4TTM8_9GAMM